MPSPSTTEGSIAVLLITDPSGARLPVGKVTVLVNPRAAAVSGSMITSSGLTPSAVKSRSRNCLRRFARLPFLEEIA